MPAVSRTCSSCSVRIARAHACNTHSLRPSHGSIKLWANSQRAASTAAATALKPKSPTSNDAGHRVLTVLHKTRSLLPHILPSEGHALSESGSLGFWERVLSKAYDDLCPTPEARQVDRVRIAVYGCDEFSGSRELVAALLEEPFASEAQRQVVHSRWEASGLKSPLVVEYTSNAEAQATLQLQSAWLLQFGAPVRILEFNSTLSTGDIASLDDLLTADIPVIVCNPASIPLDTLLSESSDTVLPLSHPNSILVLTAASVDEGLIEHIRASSGHDLTVLSVDPARALQGLRALSTAPSSPSAVQQYQDDFSGSNVPKFTQLVAQTIPQSGRAVEAAHAETARAVVQDALSACKSELSHARSETILVCDGISSLRARMEEFRVQTPREVLAGREGGNEVQHAVEKSKKDIQAILDRLKWWKLLWKVDDVGDTVNDAVSQAWCRDLEYKLIFHAGRISHLQRSLTDSASSLAASFPLSSAFHSPVLQNHLSQIAASPTFPMDSTALLHPLYTRRQQLRWPTARLQSTAQRVLLTMGGSVAGGASVAWAGWAGQLGILDFATQGETVIGVGMLGAVVGVRWAVGRFERAKKKWLSDYDRVGEGLERDLRATLERTVDERVLVVSETACSGLERAVSKRKEEIAELKEEVEVLEDELSRTHQ
ncbi:hypothetical protein C8Q72DRAFT_776135 [Fomitopsis betulina]|nr:hypothetical protein C8Q72DRAFT_776135 [Fomitopsis betulina]